MPKVLIFAGANGTGKTTLANEIVERKSRFINADHIMDRKKVSSVKAGKETLRLIDKSISKRINFSFETTMAGLGLLRRFKKLKQGKYKVVIFYLFAYPVELLVERVKERVRKGGHPVVYKDIVRRYYRSVRNFWDIYRFYSNEWVIINNNEFKYENIVTGSKGKFYIIDPIKFGEFEEVLQYGKDKK